MAPCSHIPISIKGYYHSLAGTSPLQYPMLKISLYTTLSLLRHVTTNFRRTASCHDLASFSSTTCVTDAPPAMTSLLGKARTLTTRHCRCRHGLVHHLLDRLRLQRHVTHPALVVALAVAKVPERVHAVELLVATSGCVGRHSLISSNIAVVASFSIVSTPPCAGRGPGGSARP